MGENFHQYQDYVALKNKIYSFLATGTVLKETSTSTPQFDRPDANLFILSVDKQLAQLYEIHIGFNRERLDALGNSSILDIPEDPSNRD